MASEFASGLATPTEDRVRDTARRRAAYALLMSGTSGEPVRAWSQGAARMAQALLGGYDIGAEEGAANRKEQAVRDYYNNDPRLRGELPDTGSSTAEVGGASPAAQALTDYQPSGDYNLPTPTYAQIRAPYAVRTPQEKAQLFANANAEVGGQGDVADRAYLESVVNRARARDMPTIAAATDRNYYPPGSVAGKPPGPERTAQLDAALTDVMNGSNYARGATGNASGTVGFAGGPQTLALGPGMERFGIEGPDRNTAFQPQQPGQGQQYASLGNPAQTATDAMAYAPNETAVSATDLPPQAQPPAGPRYAQLQQRGTPQIAPSEMEHIRRGLMMPETRQDAERRLQELSRPRDTVRPMTDQELVQWRVPPGSPRPGMDASGKPVYGPAGQNISVNTTANPLITHFAERLSKKADKAEAAGNAIDAIHEARTELDRGAFTGIGSDIKLVGARAASALGIDIDQSKITNTEALKSAIKSQVVSRAKELGTNPSNRDIKTLEEILGSDLNEASIRRILDVQEKWHRKTIQNYNADIGETISKEPEAYKNAPPMRVREPGQYEPPATETKTIGDKTYFKKGNTWFEGKP